MTYSEMDQQSQYASVAMVVLAKSMDGGLYVLVCSLSTRAVR